MKVEQSKTKPDLRWRRTDLSFIKKTKLRKSEHLFELTGVLLKKQNSGNQPEFQSSIKKRTVNQTVVTY